MEIGRAVVFGREVKWFTLVFYFGDINGGPEELVGSAVGCSPW